jgi:hypothetical protein
MNSLLPLFKFSSHISVSHIKNWCHYLFAYARTTWRNCNVPSSPKSSYLSLKEDHQNIAEIYQLPSTSSPAALVHHILIIFFFWSISLAPNNQSHLSVPSIFLTALTFMFLVCSIINCSCLKYVNAILFHFAHRLKSLAWEIDPEWPDPCLHLQSCQIPSFPHSIYIKWSFLQLLLLAHDLLMKCSLCLELIPELLNSAFLSSGCLS